MATSEFWRELAGQFQSLHDLYGTLRYDWHYIVGSGTGQWGFAGSASGSIRRHFEVLAARAASEIASPGATDLLVVWLEALRREGSGFRFTSTGIEPVQTGGIFDVCEASANLCRLLERQELQAEFKERQQPDPAPPPGSDIVAPSSPEETIAAQLRKLRKESRWTAEELAEAVGINTRTVTRHLSGETIPYPRNISTYERVFGKRLKRQIVINKMP